MRDDDYQHRAFTALRVALDHTQMWMERSRRIVFAWPSDFGEVEIACIDSCGISNHDAPHYASSQGSGR